MPTRLRKSPVTTVALLALVLISSSAAASKLTDVVASQLQAMADAEARGDWRRITVLGTVAYMDDRGSVRTAPP